MHGELEIIGRKIPAAFDQYSRPGQSVTGVIVGRPLERALTDFHTKAVKTFADGQPMTQFVITIQTDLRDPAIEDDDGQRRIFVKGWNKGRLREAVAAAGVTKLAEGGRLTDTFESVDGTHKIHRYVYAPPTEPPAPVAGDGQPMSRPRSLGPDHQASLRQVAAVQPRRQDDTPPF